LTAHDSDKYQTAADAAVQTFTIAVIRAQTFVATAGKPVHLTLSATLCPDSPTGLAEGSDWQRTRLRRYRQDHVLVYAHVRHRPFDRSVSGLAMAGSPFTAMAALGAVGRGRVT